jgi:hypothetical protein
LLLRRAGLGNCGTPGGAAALLFTGEFFDGDFAGEDVACELAGVAWDVWHGDLGLRVWVEYSGEGRFWVKNGRMLPPGALAWCGGFFML